MITPSDFHSTTGFNLNPDPIKLSQTDLKQVAFRARSIGFINVDEIQALTDDTVKSPDARSSHGEGSYFLSV